MRSPTAQAEPTVKPDLLTLSQNVGEGAVKEPPLTAEELDEQRKKAFQLQTLLTDASPQLLETSVEQGVKILNSIRVPLEAVADSADAQQWMHQIGMSSQANILHLFAQILYTLIYSRYFA